MPLEHAILGVIRGNRPVVFAPFMFWVILGLNYLYPPISRWLIYSTGHKRNFNQA